MRQEQFHSQIADRLGGNVGMILRKAVQRDSDLPRQLTEVRIRSGLPLAMRLNHSACFLSSDGRQTDAGRAYQVTATDISVILQRICQHSRYAYAQEIRNGYVTVPGGHRVGIAGKVIADGTITEISSLTLRICRQVRGAAKSVLPYIVRGEQDVYSTLVISPPGCGKTTLIRDIAKNLSDGCVRPRFQGVDVGIVDERSEIAACYRTVPANDLGVRTDIYDGCPKDKGILMMLRSMSPSVILTDELGGKGDLEAVLSAMNAGVRIIATAHGYGLQDEHIRPEIRQILESGLFERYVVLSRHQGPGTLEAVYGPKMEQIYERRGQSCLDS